MKSLNVIRNKKTNNSLDYLTFKLLGENFKSKEITKDTVNILNQRFVQIPERFPNSVIDTIRTCGGEVCGILSEYFSSVIKPSQIS